MRVIRQAALKVTGAAPTEETTLLTIAKKTGKTPVITEIRSSMSSVAVVGSDETHTELPPSSLVEKGHLSVKNSGGTEMDAKLHHESTSAGGVSGLMLLGELKSSKEDPLLFGKKDGSLTLSFVPEDLAKGQVPPASPGYLLLHVQVVVHYL